MSPWSDSGADDGDAALDSKAHGNADSNPLRVDRGAGMPGTSGNDPQPLPDVPGIPEPRDEPYPGVLQLEVDCTDVERRIYRVRETIPVAAAGELVLLYPKWLPGFHAPQAPIELFAGLTIEAGGAALVWKRHPVIVNAFSIEVPDGVEQIEAEFQFLSPTDASQGRVICTSDILCLQWNSVLLYPTGHYARQIMVEPSLTVPAGWQMGCALGEGTRDGDVCRFAPVALDVLVDSPVFAGRHHRRIALDDQVHLTLVADQPHLLEATPEQIAPHRAVVEQADRLFGARHFDRYEMLLGLSDELSSIGVEHHRSFEAVSLPTYFSQWEQTVTRRDTVPHEYVHSWNGKHRRGADSWQPCYEKPIRNSLMWVYEGQTQYWCRVLCARAGLWTLDHALGALAQTAARYDIRPGSRWRPTIDTTRDPIIAARAPLPWPSWQRSEDYYSEGALLWLDADTRLRELSGDTRSLDDFASAFFGKDDGSWATRTYRFDDVVQAMQDIAPFDWAGFFGEQLTDTHERAPLGGLERGGYRLVYRDTPNPFQASAEALTGTIDLTHSIGATIGRDGTFSDVLWEGPSFAARLTIGSKITAVNDRAYSADELRRAIAAAAAGAPIRLLVTKGKTIRQVEIDYGGGLRFPHLERIDDARPRIDEILQPLAG